MQDIVTIRRQLKMAGSTLRQGKHSTAVQAVLAALKIMLSKPLMKGERDELTGLVREALDYINNNDDIRKVSPHQPLTFETGKEKALHESLVQMLDALDKASMAGVEDIVKAMNAKKKDALDKGQEHLDRVEYDHARKVFKHISGEFPKDGQLRSDIGEKFLNVGCYEDAAEYYIEAVDLDPNALRNYNRLGIAFRKMRQYAKAEEYYLRALPLAPKDPYLHFNVGRLYLEWKKWGKAIEFGEKALTISPDFPEAGKLVNFARKSME